MKTITTLAFMFVLSIKVFADPFPALIQAVCEVELKNGEKIRGFVCIGVDRIATDGFYLDYEISTSYPVLFSKEMIGFNLQSGTRYSHHGKTTTPNFGSPRIYYLKDVTYNKHRTYQTEEIFNVKDGYLELIRKDIEKFILLDSLQLFDNLYNLFLDFENKDLNTKAQKIAIKDIKQFNLVIKPLDSEINEIAEAKKRFLKEHENEEELYVYFPLWYHEMYWKYDGFRIWDF